MYTPNIHKICYWNQEFKHNLIQMILKQTREWPVMRELETGKIMIPSEERKIKKALDFHSWYLTATQTQKMKHSQQFIIWSIEIKKTHSRRSYEDKYSKNFSPQNHKKKSQDYKRCYRFLIIDEVSGSWGDTHEHIFLLFLYFMSLNTHGMCGLEFHVNNLYDLHIDLNDSFFESCAYNEPAM